MQKVICPKCLHLLSESSYIKDGTFYSTCKIYCNNSDYMDYSNSAIAANAVLKGNEYKGSLTKSKLINEFLKFEKQILELGLQSHEKELLYNKYIDSGKDLNRVKREYMNSIEREKGDYWHKIKTRLRQECQTCYYCGQVNSRSIDHYLPLSLGGTNELDNLVISCDLCNKLKANYYPEVYLKFANENKEFLLKLNSINSELSEITRYIPQLSREIKKINSEYLSKGEYPSKKDVRLNLLSIRILSKEGIS